MFLRNSEQPVVALYERIHESISSYPGVHPVARLFGPRSGETLPCYRFHISGSSRSPNRIRLDELLLPEDFLQIPLFQKVLLHTIDGVWV